MFSYCSFYVIALLPLCFKSEQDCITTQNMCYIITFSAALKCFMVVLIVLIVLHIIENSHQQLILTHHGATRGILSYASFIFIF